MEKKQFFKILSKIYLIFGIVLIFLAFSTIAITFYPQIWYSLDNSATEAEFLTIERQVTILEDIVVEDISKETNLVFPEIDSTLPIENTLRIATIGVDSTISSNADAQAGLDEGIWIVPNFGAPDQNELPIIIAAHRFGYVYWSNDFREKSSFYNLPKLRVGDRVQIIWEQRSYEYEVYKAEDNTQITDYDSDLILYTCRMYNSPIRVFRYLRRIY